MMMAANTFTGKDRHRMLFAWQLSDGGRSPASGSAAEWLVFSLGGGASGLVKMMTVDL